MFNDKTVVVVHPNRIEDFLKQKCERVEIFIDDEGNLFLVRKGDLEAYWLRKEKRDKLKKIIKQKQNEFLGDIYDPDTDLIGGPFLEN